MPSIKKCNKRNPPPPCLPGYVEEFLDDGVTKCCYTRKKKTASTTVTSAAASATPASATPAATSKPPSATSAAASSKPPSATSAGPKPAAATAATVPSKPAAASVSNLTSALSKLSVSSVGATSKPSKTKKSSSLSSKSSSIEEYGPNMLKYLDWVKMVKNTLSKPVPSIILDERVKKSGETILNKEQTTTIPRAKVPDEAKSIVMMMPYNEDDDYKNSKFIKLHTCSKTCPNKGIFEVDEIKTYSQNASKCIMCQEPFSYSSKQLTPPIYGQVSLSIVNYPIRGVMHRFYQIIFQIHPGQGPPPENKQFVGTTRVAYIPILPNKRKEEHDKSILGVWMYLQAWKQNCLFNLGDSLTTLLYGVTYGTIHMKSSMDPYNMHSYGFNPTEYYKKTALLNLLSECSAHNIFTPKMQDSFLLDTKKPASV